MICGSCGSEWWEERRVLRVAAAPATDPRFQTTAREVVYRLVCADCSAPHDQTNSNSAAPRRRRKAVA